MVLYHVICACMVEYSMVLYQFVNQKGANLAMIVVIGGEKGGTGKTTIATNLASLHIKQEKEVLLIDTDMQGSASSWAATRETNDDIKRIPSVQKFGKGLTAEIKELSQKYDSIIIDAGGRDSVELRASIIVADKLYIPIQASQFDVWTIAKMDQLVENARTYNPKLEAFIVFNRASTNRSVNETQEAIEIVRNDFEQLNIFDGVLHDRIAYRKAAKLGLSVTEIPNPDHKAINEITLLYEEIFNG